MRGYLLALLYASLPALGNVTGGLLAEKVRASTATLSYALHAAAGVVFAVVGLELMPRAIEADPPWLPVFAFAAGGGFFLVADRAIDTVNRRFGRGEDAGPWAIYLGVAMDLFSDGVMIGASSLVGGGLALLLALGQVPGDLPQGFAVISTFRNRGVARRTRLLVTLALALPVLVGASVGYWAVRGQPEIVTLAILAFTAGVLTVVVVEEMVPEAHRGGEVRNASLALIGGFSLFALLSAYLG